MSETMKTHLVNGKVCGRQINPFGKKSAPAKKELPKSEKTFDAEETKKTEGESKSYTPKSKSKKGIVLKDKDCDC